MLLLEYIFYITSALYAIILIAAFFALLRFHKSTKQSQPKISIVIAARNEAQRITPTLQSLEKIEYPAELFEVILVDDASTDDTVDVIQPFLGKNQNWHCLQITNKDAHWHGKKLALKTGIEAAQGEIIFVTDADCILQPKWLSQMAPYFTQNVSMVIGHYEPLVRKNNLVGLLIKFDNLFSSIIASVTANLGFPISSAGSNLAYRKSDYDKVQGHAALQKFKSGDDVHLTERFRTQLKKKIVYCANPDTFVFTKPPTQKKDFFQQQMRKNSKHLKKSVSSILFSLFLLSFFVLSYIFPLIDPLSFSTWFWIIISKLLLEFIILTRAASVFKRKDIIIYFPLFQILYPIYIITFSFLGNLQLYQWNK